MCSPADPVLRSLRSHYRSGTDDLGAEFFGPCLRLCVRYSRAAAYFTSDSLATWIGALPRLVGSSNVRIRLLISPILSGPDLEALRTALERGTARETLRRRIADDVLADVLRDLEPVAAADARRRVFAWLVANDRLSLRFAFPKHFDQAGMFHEKIGIFEFADGSSVAFTGSANETAGGHKRNYESIDVFRSWKTADEDRVRIKVKQFEDAWGGNAAGLAVEEPSPEMLARIRTYAPTDNPLLPGRGLDPDPEANRWRHQDEAISSFLQHRRGVLEMATGTGKTRTALRIYSALKEGDEIDGLIVTTSGTDLLKQWGDELLTWVEGSYVSIYRHFERFHELGRFLGHPRNSALVISRQQLVNVLSGLPADERARIMIVHDEVHGLGSPQNRRDLAGEHGSFPYVLGLSATPERSYDEEGNRFIEEEIGDVIFKFGLREAIERGILCEFDYEPLGYELTENDRQRLQSVYALQAARAKDGKPMQKEEVWRHLADVYKTAENKVEVFADYLAKRPDTVVNAVIFVHTTEYGDRLLDIVHKYTRRYSTYYSDDQREQLESFSRGDLECLITCHRIAEGIDVPGLETVVLFASDRSRLGTIQRIGRCLRTDPGNPDKRARIVDFVRPDAKGTRDPEADQRVSADEERSDWLFGLSRTRREG
jgi:superfamily II DNA or RNA helicase